MTPTPEAQIRQAFGRLDQRVRRAVDSHGAALLAHAQDPFRGLYISECDVQQLVAELSPVDRDEPAVCSEVPSRCDRLADLFRLDPFEMEALLICLAPDVDVRYERVYAYLQDDVSRRRPTADLVLRLLRGGPELRSDSRCALGAGGRLHRRGLLTWASSDDAAAGLSLLARPLRVDERVVEYVLGSDRLDARLAGFAQLLQPDMDNHVRIASVGQSGLQSALSIQDANGRVVYVHGPGSAAKSTLVRTAAAATGRRLLNFDVPAVLRLDAARGETIATAAAREALLQDAVLVFTGFDHLVVDAEDALMLRSALQLALDEHRGTVLLLGERAWDPAVWLPNARTQVLRVPPLGRAERAILWEGQFGSDLDRQQIADLASRYRITDTEVLGALRADACARAEARKAERPGVADFRAAARAIVTPALDGLATQIEPRYGWGDIVLPADGLAQLREICARLHHQVTVLEEWGYGRKHARRAGLTALFSGSPGTGKTMAAEIVAGDLGLSLYRIDLSAVVSKYIGETEKNLERIFGAADQGDVVLLFDEADAIFGKRSEVRDARDRYANVEVAYLLQRLETYEGLAILTTNLRGNIDEAFIRRLDSVLEFPVPEESERLQIWRRSMPEEAPLDPDVDLEFLARKFKLAGGYIRNIALTAAFLAAADGLPIGMKQLARATRREYQKLGKLIGESDFVHQPSLARGA